MIVAKEMIERGDKAWNSPKAFFLNDYKDVSKEIEDRRESMSTEAKLITQAIADPSFSLAALNNDQLVHLKNVVQSVLEEDRQSRGSSASLNIELRNCFGFSNSDLEDYVGALNDEIDLVLHVDQQDAASQSKLLSAIHEGGYDLRLMDNLTRIKPGVLYIKDLGNVGLQYTVKSNNQVITDKINAQELATLGISVPLPKNGMIKQLKPKLSDILNITSRRGDTHKGHRYTGDFLAHLLMLAGPERTKTFFSNVSNEIIDASLVRNDDGKLPFWIRLANQSPEIFKQALLSLPEDKLMELMKIRQGTTYKSPMLFSNLIRENAELAKVIVDILPQERLIELLKLDDSARKERKHYLTDNPAAWHIVSAALPQSAWQPDAARQNIPEEELIDTAKSAATATNSYKSRLWSQDTRTVMGKLARQDLENKWSVHRWDSRDNSASLVWQSDFSGVMASGQGASGLCFNLQEHNQILKTDIKIRILFPKDVEDIKKALLSNEALSSHKIEQDYINRGYDVIIRGVEFDTLETVVNDLVDTINRVNAENHPDKPCTLPKAEIIEEAQFIAATVSDSITESRRVRFGR